MYVLNGSHLITLEGKFSLILSYSIIYCKDNIKCDSVSNFFKCPLINGVTIVQKLVVKLSNTSTTFSQQVKIALPKCLRV